MNYDFEFATSSQLDVLFFTSYAGRTISPIVNYHTTDGSIDDNNLLQLSEEILAVYKQKWDRLKEVALLDYDPIHNFSDNISEHVVSADDSTRLNTGNVKDSGTVTDTGTVKDTGDVKNTGTQGIVSETDNTGTQQNVSTGSRDTRDKIYGFNSSASSGQNDQDIDTTDNSTRTDNLKEEYISTRTDNLTQTNDLTRTNNLTRTNDLTRTNNLSEKYEDDFSKDRTMTRTGNIGNITTQAMLTQEIELWKWNFVNQVLSDVKEFCTLSIYNS